MLCCEYESAIFGGVCWCDTPMESGDSLRGSLHTSMDCDPGWVTTCWVNISIAGVRFRSKNEAVWPGLVGCNGHAVGAICCGGFSVVVVDDRRAPRAGTEYTCSELDCFVGVLDWVKNCV